ncbi:MCE family protein [Ramlibacter sp. MAH-25]|uniref:MCE family protein n=1 Tax=Ramlibacter pinisoli TaxID=2682844 RepID=A0A6N8J017_9BURK|nr:MCE family protein [Ramlibacter pinisoli]
MQGSIEKRAWWVFAAVLLAAAAAAAAWYVGLPGSYATYELRTQDPVSGLIEGSPVEFHGVEVGSVHEVRLLDARTVQVLLHVRREAPVTKATVATISGRGLATRGFTGYVYVSLEDKPGGGAALVRQPGESYTRIPTAPVESVTLDTSIHQLNESVRGVTAMLQDTLDADTIRALKSTVANLQQVSTTLAADQARLRSTLANMERASAQLPPLLQAGGEVARGLRDGVLPHAENTLARIDGVAQSAAGTLQQVDAAGKALAPMAQSGQAALRTIDGQLLPQTRQMLARMNELLSKLDDTADRVRDNPSVLVWGPRPQPATTGPERPESGQHAQERVVAPPEVVVQRCPGMQCNQAEQGIGQPAVQDLQRLEQARLQADQVRNVEPAEHGHGVTAR